MTLPVIRRHTTEPGHRGSVLAVALGVFCIQLDSFALNLALPAIGGELGTSTDQTQWTISAYLFAVSTCMLGAGRVGDLYGRRRMLLVGLGAFGVGSTLCALAGSVGWLVGARVVQGIGGALIMPVGMALLTNLYPAQRRARMTGLALGIGGIGTACGPFLGGALTEACSWRAIFWINVPLAVVAAWCLSAVPESRDRTRAGLVDLALFTNRPFVALTLAGAVANSATVVFLFVVPQVLQASWGLPADTAGAVFLAPSVLMALAGPISGRVPTRHVVAVMIAALLAAAGAALAAAHARMLVSYVAAIATTGASLGMANALALVATQGVIEPARAGEAAGVTKTVVTVAGAFGVALISPLVGAESVPSP